MEKESNGCEEYRRRPGSRLEPASGELEVKAGRPLSSSHEETMVFWDGISMNLYLGREFGSERAYSDHMALL